MLKLLSYCILLFSAGFGYLNAQSCPLSFDTYHTNINGTNELWLINDAFVVRQEKATDEKVYYKLLWGANCTMYLQQASGKGAFYGAPRLTLTQAKLVDGQVQAILIDGKDTTALSFDRSAEKERLRDLMKSQAHREMLSKVEKEHNKYFTRLKGEHFIELYNVNPYLYEVNDLLKTPRIAKKVVDELLWMQRPPSYSANKLVNARYNKENVTQWTGLLNYLLGELQTTALIGAGQYQDKFERYLFEAQFSESEDPLIAEVEMKKEDAGKWLLQNVTLLPTGRLDKAQKIGDEIFSALREGLPNKISNYSSSKYKVANHVEELEAIASKLEGVEVYNYQPERIVVREGEALVLLGYTFQNEGDYMVSVQLVYQNGALGVADISLLSLN